jgi:type III pantothenate kinase
VLIVDSHTRTGLRFKYGRGQLGADRLCDAVGAVGRFGGNLIVLDFGTAFTVNVISEEGVFLGGAILPGFGLMADSLAWGTAALPHVTFRHVLNPIQHGTKSAIRAGISSLAAGGVDGIIGQIEEQTGMSFLVVATGGYASLMRRCVGRIRVVDPHLASRGLAELLYMNTPAPRAGD